MSIEMKQLLEEMKVEFGIANVKAINYAKYSEVWEVKYKKGKPDTFQTFESMYEFLKTENVD